jgi:hypothetical protein
MRWFRSHIRLGSRLALFALAVQVVLCFSHIDSCDLGLVAAKAAPAAAIDTGQAAPGKSTPIKKSDRADTTCPICALIQLASTSPPATAPTLPSLTKFVRIRPQAPDAVSLAASPHFSFQARAPPAA